MAVTESTIVGRIPHAMRTAAVAGILYALESDAILESGVYIYGRSAMYDVVNIYAIRMAGVFMMSLGTIWLRTGLMHCAWTYVIYTLALIMLVSLSYTLWVPLLFPAWVLGVSVHFLLRHPHGRAQDAMGKAGIG